MEIKPIIIVAAEEDQSFYAGFKLDNERLLFQAPQELLGNIGSLEADLIVLDAGNPPELGLDLLVKIKPECPGVPIIFLTSDSSEYLVLSAYKQGVRDYFRKSDPLSSLHGTIKKLLHLKRSANENRGFEASETHRLECSISRSDQLNDISPVAQSVIRYIEKNIRKKITLEDLCQVVKTSKYHFSRKFKAETGMSPMQYVRHEKIKAAKSLLLRTDSNVSSVAYLLGFEDVSSFIRNFKKYEGVTPYRFRTSNKQGDRC